MKEWGDKFNSFNSWKGLLYSDWYKGIAKGEFLPPIEASLDPIHACNLRCQHCNAHRYLGDDAGKMTTEHLMDLVKFLADWGVKAVCFGGGGEPTLHPDLAKAIILARAKGMECSIATNGTNITPELLDAASLCRWIGVSVDAADPGTYERLKGVDAFSTAITNLGLLVSQAGDKCDISYKFLISSINQHQILDACRLARDIGVKDFHARPMDFHHQGMGEELDGRLANVDVSLIRGECYQCHKYETDDFHVYTVFHKFNSSLQPVKNFSQCWAAPLTIQICADGWVYLCVDQRHNPKYRVTRHDDPSAISEAWGGEHHRAMCTKEGRPATCTTRCTHGVFAEQCERLFIDQGDPMCWKFT